MTARSLVVVTAGLSQPSSTRLLADRLANAAAQALRTASLDATVTVLELRDHAQDLVNNLLTGFPSPALRAAVESVVAADGIVAVSPIFNASYSGLFKLFFDVLERDSLDGKPVLLGATGGTPRHSLALEHAIRPMFVYLGADVMPTAVFAAAADWGTNGDEEDALAERIERAGRQLAQAVARGEPAQPADPFAAAVPFEQLLASLEGPSRD